MQDLGLKRDGETNFETLQRDRFGEFMSGGCRKSE